MSLEKQRISKSQLKFLILSYILGSTTYVSFADTITKHDTWLVFISAYAASVPFIVSYVVLVKRFPGSNIIQINDMVYGTYLGKLISILYLWFILTVFSLNLKGLADFYITFIMPDAPDLLFLVVCTLVCAYGLWKGIETISRISFTIMVVVAFVIIISFLLQLKDMNFSYFLPFFELSPKTYFQGIHIVASIQFCEIMIFMIIMPNLNDFTHAGKNIINGTATAAFLLIMVAIRNTAVLGIASPIYVSDSYQAFRLIDIGNVLTKMDILFAIALTIVMFIRICALYYATVAGTSQLLKLRSTRTLIFPLGSIAVCLSLILFDSTVEHNFHARNYHAVLATPFEFIFPPLTLLVAKIRRLPELKGGKAP